MRLKHWAMHIGFAAAGFAFSAPSFAAEPLTVGLGGRLREYFFVADQATAPAENLNTAGQFNQAVIAADAKTILANGITIRAYGRYDIANGNSQNLNQAFVEVGTGFGRMRIGTNFDANTMLIGDPVPQAFLTSDEELIGDALKPRTAIGLRDAFTFKRFTQNAGGISLQSPEFIGIRVGVTYHPTTDATSGTFNTGLKSHDAVDVTAAYAGDFTGGTYRVAGGYFTAAAPSLFPNQGSSAWNLAVGVTYGGWELAGAYIAAKPPGGLDEKAWTVGVLYAIGPWKISADFRHLVRDRIFGAARSERVDRMQVQSAYKLGPGISLGLVGFYADQQTAAGPGYDSKGMLGGIKLDF